MAAVLSSHRHGDPLELRPFLRWSCEDVARWVADMGFPQYRADRVKKRSHSSLRMCGRDEFRDKLLLNYRFISCDVDHVCREMWIDENMFSMLVITRVPDTKECFTSNFISGQKLILINCSSLPRIGITNFDHMKRVNGVLPGLEVPISILVLAQAVRNMVGVIEAPFIRSIAYPRCNLHTFFLEKKTRTGLGADALTQDSCMHMLKNINCRSVELPSFQ